MFKCYRNRLIAMGKTNKVSSLDHVNKCTKCARLNPSLYSAALNNVQCCLFCGNPFYIVKTEK